MYIMYRLFAWLAAWTGSSLSTCLEWCRGRTRDDQEQPEQLEQQRLPHLDSVCTVH